MSTKKMTKLLYCGKPLTRRGNTIYYGNLEDKYLVILRILDTKDQGSIKVATKVSIELVPNTPNAKPFKKAERDGLFKAMDIAEFWLEDALSQG